MTTRRWMIAVAVVAFWFGTARWLRAWSDYLVQQSKIYEELWIENCCGHVGDLSTTPREILRKKREAYYRMLSDKYWHASFRPWLPVEPDLPPPK
jgi:hypothetical protein